MRNIELKARLRDIEQAEKICQDLRADFQGVLNQRDTYFRVPEGRLKLREFDDRAPELIVYRRDNIAESKPSDYHIARVEPETRDVLSRALGVLVVVKKARRLWIWKGVRIHLDEVESLGTFLEFEAVLSDGLSDEEGTARVAYLREALTIEEADLLSDSYSDMLLRKNERSSP